MTVDYRPRRLVRVCRVAGAALLLVFAVIAYLLPRGTSGGQQFGLADQIAFFGIGVLLTWVVLQFTRVRVVADEAGVLVRNYIGEKRIPWQVVAGIRMDASASWATLDLYDDDTIALLAVQANDGKPAADAVVALRRLLAASRTRQFDGLPDRTAEDSQD